MAQEPLEVGALVQVRGQKWVVSDLDTTELPQDELSSNRLPGHTVASLMSVSEDDLGEQLRVVWDIEPGRSILPAGALPNVPQPERWDSPDQLGALLDALRWGSVASADTRTLQAPFRSGIQIKEYQLEPAAKALAMPRVSLLVADDVGLGKTIEAGLVIQEMLLRHRARRIIIVCPASLTRKWHEELRDKFGLDFTVLDSAALKVLRRTHGLLANPFNVYSRTIISLSWLRSPRVQRLMDEVLNNTTRQRGFFDMLVVDEAHHCAPPAPAKGNRGYAVDSQQTAAVRRVSDHTQHRIFLSATPHNGYPESWEALLAMVDPQRFVRGVTPDPKLLQEVLVRRLKDDVVSAEGTREFAERLPVTAIEVEYSDAEREGYRLLTEYTSRLVSSSGAKHNEFVAILLKKRFFSSPTAFQKTLECHAQTVQNGSSATDRSQPEIPFDYDSEDEPDDSPGSSAESIALKASATVLDSAERDLLAQLMRWANVHASPADSKAERLISELNEICRPGGTWSDERVVVFTEYRDTQQWLFDILQARGLGDNHLKMLYGGMAEHEREQVKAAFQASPERDELRILLATDAASEGIDLQAHCCRIINYDIPFNPNRLEQRIGRIDRFGQTRPVHVSHFVGAGWRDPSTNSYDADLEFLSRVAEKVARTRADLGPVNAILAQAVEAVMLGQEPRQDPFSSEPKGTQLLQAERGLREQIARLRAQLDQSIHELHVAPKNIRRLVDTALGLASQPDLIDNGDGTFAIPELSRGWERTVTGIEDPLDPSIRRPITFDPKLANADVVHAHLEWGLVSQAQRLLRSAIWGEQTTLSRVTGIQAPLPAEIRPGEFLVVVVTRFVLVGADGARLHEEIILAARAIPEVGRSRRLELESRRYGELRDIVEGALDPGSCIDAPIDTKERFFVQWAELSPLLSDDVSARGKAHLESLSKLLEIRQREELDQVDRIAQHMHTALTTMLEAKPSPLQLRFDELDEPERVQYERDRQVWRERLDSLEIERLAERDRIERRYRDVKDLTFPAAVVLVANASEHG
ncbi:DISARM system SNF2-like helicase DrmD [Ferrimicrobium sp.]|uniref:DISARM system SNF2-like helicase DrmD n=1 Tax=Ferrimicrobium sp. TaxID=2926050 RepID=UPI0026297E0C|nr:DISARM system SNF2-like helicase DrmD [Ferrimicrobium sp.]